MKNDDELSQDYLAARGQREVQEGLEYLRSRRASPTEAPAGPAPTAPAKRDALDVALSVVGDVGRGIVEAPGQVAGGAIDAANEVLDLTKEAGDALERLVPLGGFQIDGDGFRYVNPDEFEQKFLEQENTVKLPTTGEADSVTGSAVRSISQFVTGFIATGPLLKGVGGATRAGKVAEAATRGAVTDFAAFDPQEERLSNLVQSVPELENPVTEWLATEEGDSKLGGRIKNTLEGMGLGVLTDSLMASLRGVKKVRQMKSGDLPEPKIVDPNESLGNTKGKLVTTKPSVTDEQAKAFLETATDGSSKAGNINLARLNTPEDVDEAIRATAEMFSDNIAEASRGVQSNELTEKLADDLGMDAVTLLKRRKGQAFNAEEALAARRVLASSGAQLMEFAKKARGGGEQDLYAFRRALSVHRAIQAQVSGITAEAGRALQAFKISAGAEETTTKAIRNLLEATGGERVTRDMADKLAAFDDPRAFNAFASEIAKATTTDMVLEAWINGLLSSPTTHVVNAVSNSATALWQIPERLLASALDGTGTIRPNEAVAQFYGLTRGARDGLRLAYSTLRTGEPSDVLQKMEMPRHRAITGENLGLSGTAGHAADFIGETVRLPGRFLMASDDFFKSMGYRMELNALAYREAAAEGLEGEDFARRVTEIISNPPEHIELASIDAARYQTFTNPPGEFTGGVQGALNSWPVTRLVVPFIRTPSNIARFVFQRTPLAPVLSSVREDLAAGGARAALAKARLGLGSFVMLGVADMIAEGTATGGGPSDPGLRSVWRETHQPYSIKIGDTWHAYNRLDPLGMIVGLSADVTEAMGDASEEDREALPVAIFGAMAKNLTSKTYLSGVADLMEAASNPDRYGERWVQRYAGTLLPFSSLTGAIERVQDPALRDTRATIRDEGPLKREREFVEGLVNEMRSRVPGYSDTLPPRRNIFGETILLTNGMAYEVMSPIYTQDAKPSPVADEIWRNRVSLQMPARSIKGVELTAEEYSRYVELAGQPAKAHLERRMKTGFYKRQSDGPDGGKALIIKEVFSAYRQDAQRHLIDEFPELKAQIKKRLDEEGEALRPAPTFRGSPPAG